jgi:hypothetical protein
MQLCVIYCLMLTFYFHKLILYDNLQKIVRDVTSQSLIIFNLQDCMASTRSFKICFDYSQSRLLTTWTPIRHIVQMNKHKENIVVVTFTSDTLFCLRGSTSAERD